MKRFLTTLLVLALTVALAAPAFAKDEYIYAHYNSAESLTGQAAQMYVDYINDNSENIHITIYHGGELGGITECMEQCVTGAIQFTAVGWGQASNLYTPVEVLAMPYLVKSGEDLRKLFAGDCEVINQLIADFEANTNMKVVGSTASPDARQLTCNFPVYTPDDLKGEKVRSINSPIYTMAVESMGAVAVPIDWVEVATALSTGVVVGQENPITTLRDYQMWDYQAYVMMTNHIFDCGAYVVNMDTWNSLSAEDQEIVTSAAKLAADWSYATTAEQVEEAKAACVENGMTFITEADGLDVSAFKANAEAAIAKDYAQYTGTIDAINEFLGY